MLCLSTDVLDYLRLEIKLIHFSSVSLSRESVGKREGEGEKAREIEKGREREQIKTSCAGSHGNHTKGGLCARLEFTISDLIVYKLFHAI